MSRRGSLTVRPKKALLSTRSYIDQMDGGLTSVQGAQEIISMITSRRLVTKLILGHNQLGSAGCIVLFRFLSSAIGRKYRITEISLNSNEIGDEGLLAIAEHLKNDVFLKEFFLQNNRFTGDATVMRTFASCLNQSRLEVLSLTTNNMLSDPFSASFFPTLNSDSLQELHISSTGITQLSLAPIIEYITSRRCRLHTLKCNGNNFGLRGVSSLVKAIDTGNYSLVNVELFSNHSATPDDADDEDIPDWKTTESLLGRVLGRNIYLRQQTAREALELLRHSRAAILHPSSRFPTEIQLYILSFLAPSLSEAQRLNIYNYASTTKTLPNLLPTLQSFEGPACIPDPVNMGLSVWEIHRTGGCTSCSGSLVCYRDQERQKWLGIVQCSFFDRGYL
ncbi:hypothetical protein CPB85DRAFT_285899 [Mucidula mucida]|nr:hypothetical protein CPB85DRAFT_285899 [Mucidula mucida]